MKKIDTIEELRIERSRLRSKRYALESEIKMEFAQFKAEFAPLRALSNGTINFLSDKNENVLTQSAGSIIDFVLKNFVLQKTGLVTRLVLPFLAKKLTSNYVDGHKGKIANWIGNLIEKIDFTQKKSQVE